MIIHAAGESSPGGLTPDTYAVALTARDEAALASVSSRLRDRGVPLTEVREPNAPYDGALMALGLAPARKEVLRRLVSSLPLLR